MNRPPSSDRAAPSSASDDSDDDARSRSSVASSTTPPAPAAAPPPAPAPDAHTSADWCVVCFENPSNTQLEPCGHANLCDACVSRLGKRRCPTCRARAKRVRIFLPDAPPADPGTGAEGTAAALASFRGKGAPHGVAPGDGPLERYVVKTVKQVIAERRMRESRTLEDTLQIVFAGPAEVGKRTLVRKLLAAHALPEAERPPTPSLVTDADADVYGNGTDFGANATMSGTRVRLTVLRRGTLTSRRMLLDDVRVLKPDILVMCCSAHVGNTYDEMLSWDKVLRANLSVPRLWALLTHPRFGELAAPSVCAHPTPVPPLDQALNVPFTIATISPTSARPRAHYICATGGGFSIGLRSLTRDVVSYGRTARDEALAAAVAFAEERSQAEHELASFRRGSSDAPTPPGGGGGARRAGSGLAPSSAQTPVRASDPAQPAPAAAPAPLAAEALLGVRAGALRGLSIRTARESARDVNNSLTGFVSWFTGQP